MAERRSSKLARVFLGVGSNQGDRLRNLTEARRRVRELPQTRLSRCSSVYVTAPVGGPPQQDYFNQVLEIETSLPPRELLSALQDIESRLGRVREVRWGPRTLDLDILWYDGYSTQEADLTLPHPRLEERRFVLEPLAELAPDLVLLSGRTVKEALLLVDHQQVEPLGGSEPDDVAREHDEGP